MAYTTSHIDAHFNALRKAAKKPFKNFSLTQTEIRTEELQAAFVDPYTNSSSDEDHTRYLANIHKHVPVFSFAQWLYLFIAEMIQRPSFEKPIKSFIERVLASIDGDCAPDMTEDVYNAITPLNDLAIGLILRKCIADDVDSLQSLREIIGLLMNRAPEFVFSTDPDLADCWTLSEIEEVDGDYVVTWEFIDGFPLDVCVTCKPGGKLKVISKTPKLQELAPANMTFRKFLDDKSRHAVRDLLSQT